MFQLPFDKPLPTLAGVNCSSAPKEVCIMEPQQLELPLSFSLEVLSHLELQVIENNTISFPEKD